MSYLKIRLINRSCWRCLGRKSNGGDEEQALSRVGIGQSGTTTIYTCIYLLCLLTQCSVGSIALALRAYVRALYCACADRGQFLFPFFNPLAFRDQHSLIFILVLITEPKLASEWHIERENQWNHSSVKLF